MASTQALDELPAESNEGNDNSNQQNQKNRRHKLLCELLLDFARNTTLHGPRYITERGLSVVEKMFWMVTFITSLSLCIWLMWRVWVKWETSPVIISLSEQLESVAEIPFPAVTICPQTKIKQEFFNYTKHKVELGIFARDVLMKLPKTSHEEAIKNFTENNPLISELHGMDLVCRGEDNDLLLYEFPTKFVNYSAVHSFQRVAPGLRDILSFGAFQSLAILPQMDQKEQHLHPVLTSEGFCFSFNSLHVSEIFRMDRVQSDYAYEYLVPLHMPSEWSLQDGYFSRIPNIYRDYPHRGRAKGGNPDLVLYLNEVMDRDILCDGMNKGFKVYLHHPADLPQSSLYYYAVLPEQVASFAIKPIVMKTADTLANYLPHVRQCYYHGEKDLRYFKVYTPNNCYLECQTNYTLQFCGCVWFHMPHSEEVELCSIKKYTCVLIALEKLSIEDASKTSVCDCMPLCHSVQYEADVLKSQYNANEYYNALRRIDKIMNNQSEDSEARFNFDKSNTKIEMYFKDPQFRAMLRSELFGVTEFLSAWGGLLGLFLGFSFLSLVEIFYFFTLRLGCRLRRNNKAEEKENDNHLKNV